VELVPSESYRLKGLVLLDIHWLEESVLYESHSDWMGALVLSHRHWVVGLVQYESY